MSLSSLVVLLSAVSLPLSPSLLQYLSLSLSLSILLLSLDVYDLYNTKHMAHVSPHCCCCCSSCCCCCRLCLLTVMTAIFRWCWCWSCAALLLWRRWRQWEMFALMQNWWQISSFFFFFGQISENFVAKSWDETKLCVCVLLFPANRLKAFVVTDAAAR